MRDYYSRNFGSQRHLEGQRVNARTNGVVLQRLLDLKQVKSWLDIGCGYGFLLKWLAGQGIAAEGVNYPAKRRILRARRDCLSTISRSLNQVCH